MLNRILTMLLVASASLVALPGASAVEDCQKFVGQGDVAAGGEVCYAAGTSGASTSANLAVCVSGQGCYYVISATSAGAGVQTSTTVCHTDASGFHCTTLP